MLRNIIADMCPYMSSDRELTHHCFGSVSVFRRVMAVLGLLVVSTLCLNTWADEPAAPAPQAIAAAAPAPNAAEIAEMQHRLADLEAYVNNGARADDATSRCPARARATTAG